MKVVVSVMMVPMVGDIGNYKEGGGCVMMIIWIVVMVGSITKLSNYFSH